MRQLSSSQCDQILSETICRLGKCDKTTQKDQDIDENCLKNLDVGDAIEPNLRSIQGKMHTVDEVYVKPLMYGRRRGAEEEG